MMMKMMMVIIIITILFNTCLRLLFLIMLNTVVFAVVSAGGCNVTYSVLLEVDKSRTAGSRPITNIELLLKYDRYFQDVLHTVII